MLDFASPDTPAHWIRARTFRVDAVALELRIDLDARTIRGTVTHTIVFFPHASRLTVDLDCDGPVIEAVSCAGAPVPFSHVGARLSLATAALSGEHEDSAERQKSVERQKSAERLELVITFTTTAPRKGMTFIAADANRNQVAMAWTQGAMEDHHYWFPCFDDPNNFSTYAVTITHPVGTVALANGDQTAHQPDEPGWLRTSYAQTKAHVLYLLNIVVGDFVGVDSDAAVVAGRAIPIRHWLPAGHAHEAGVFRATRFAIEWLSDYTGMPFAWSRYGHVVVHEFLWGGMENTTLTTITDRVLIDDATRAAEDVDADYLVIHELVHQWYGDLLTMKAWSDIWLNESFATWLECRGTAAWRASRDEGDESEVRHLLLWENREHYLDQHTSRYRRPLVTNRYDDAYELFDRVAYEKGSLVLEHLAQLLGEKRMRAAIALYTTRHAGELVESDDFRQAIEDATGEPMDWFFAQWLRRDGHPHLSVAVSHDAGRGQISVTISQKLADKEEPWRLPTVVAWCVDGIIQRTALNMSRRDEHLVLACSAAPTWVVVDPDGHLPVEWSEPGDEAALLARAREPGLSATARARACVALGERAASATAVASLADLATADQQPELVRRQAIAALGAWRSLAAIAALQAAADLPQPRLRRAVAEALGRCALADPEIVAALAADLVQRADAEPSLLTAGEFLAARGALRHPGATALLRSRLGTLSWNDRLLIGAIRGLGASGEAAAIDETLPLLADRQRSGPVRQAAAAAAARLAAEHIPAQVRVRIALQRQLADPSASVRAVVAKALGSLGDPAARSALGEQRDREIYGHIRRVQREALHSLESKAALSETQAGLTRKIDQLTEENRDLKRRLDNVEKRLA